MDREQKENLSNQVHCNSVVALVLFRRFSVVIQNLFLAG